ncbi:MAG: YbaK/EbsC family protein [Candidatus Nanopelagicales bacterium]
MADLPGPVARVAGELTGLGAAGTPQPSPVGFPPIGEAVVTTEIFEADGRPVLVVCDGHADPVDLAGVLGAMTVRPVPAPVATLWTGQDPGAIAPVGHARPVTIVIGINLARWRRIWVPAGAPGYHFPTTYSELLRITAGTAAEVGELPSTGGASPIPS